MRQILSYIPNLRIEVMLTKHGIACMLMVLLAACCHNILRKTADSYEGRQVPARDRAFTPE